jgi:E3 ubiquitin-protein ligase RNF1/2
MEGNTFLTPSSRARGHRASASSALLQELERTAANASASSGGRGSLGISRELSKLINKKTPTMTKEQVMRKVRGQQGGGGGEEDEEEECVEGLTLYETYREPISPPDDPHHTTTLQVRTLNVELTCPICLGIMRQTMTVMECLHRFCDECISKCLRWGKKECPTCRVHCSSRRHLRPDPNFDALIATVYPNLDEYEAQEQEFIADINKRMNRKSLTDSVEKGLMRQMAASRGPRAKRDKEQLEAMEAPSTTPSSSSSSSSSSRKRKPTPSSVASSSSFSSSSSTVSSAPAGVSSSSSSSSSSRSKNSKRSKSQDTYAFPSLTRMSGRPVRCWAAR